MDIALLSANANQLRFLITYNHEASTFYYSLVLVILSLVLQLFVGIVLIFKVLIFVPTLFVPTYVSYSSVG